GGHVVIVGRLVDVVRPAEDPLPLGELAGRDRPVPGEGRSGDLDPTPLATGGPLPAGEPCEVTQATPQGRADELAHGADVGLQPVVPEPARLPPQCLADGLVEDVKRLLELVRQPEVDEAGHSLPEPIHRFPQRTSVASRSREESAAGDWPGLGPPW